MLKSSEKNTTHIHSAIVDSSLEFSDFSTCVIIFHHVFLDKIPWILVMSLIVAEIAGAKFHYEMADANRELPVRP